MARHRDIRNMDFTDEYDGYDDIYGHSVDDDYYVSPSHRQFMYNRENSKEYRNEDDILEEDEVESQLSDLDKAKLESCLEQIKTQLETTPMSRNDLVNIILKHNFNLEAIKNVLENPKFDNTLGRKETAPTPLTTSSETSSTKVVLSTPKTATNITKGFELSQKEPAKRSSQLTPRSQSPDSGRNTPNVPSEISEDSKVTRADSKLTPQELYDKERGNDKEHINLVIIGHVDAGKSTLMGRLLCDLGQINQKTIQKYEHESKKVGKQSFMYAWVLDETGEERNRGITMDVGRSQFETDKRVVTILDAPGHKDFIPNMISGASEADVALLVVDSTKGEFETGFESGGQTREHTILVKSLGVTQLAIAVNKLDNVSWSKERFDGIVKKLKNFLKQAGFKESDVAFVPCSGLTGQNLVKKPTEEALLSWYDGPCLLEVIDSFKPPERLINKPFRMPISDIYKVHGSSFCVYGRVLSGTLRQGDSVVFCPNGSKGEVKALMVNNEKKSVVFAGDCVSAIIVDLPIDYVMPGHVMCDADDPVPASNRFHARVVTFDLAHPITKGSLVELCHVSSVEPVYIKKVLAQLNKSTGEVVKKNPRFLGENSCGILDIMPSKTICLEEYSSCKELGRIMLRERGRTIGVGIISHIVPKKSTPTL